MGSRVTRVMSFLPANFQLAGPFLSQLRVRHGTDRQTDRQTDRRRDWETGGQTDRRTDRQRPWMLYATTLWGRGHNNAKLAHYSDTCRISRTSVYYWSCQYWRSVSQVWVTGVPCCLSVTCLYLVSYRYGTIKPTHFLALLFLLCLLAERQ